MNAPAMRSQWPSMRATWKRSPWHCATSTRPTQSSSLRITTTRPLATLGYLLGAKDFACVRRPHPYAPVAEHPGRCIYPDFLAVEHAHPLARLCALPSNSLTQPTACLTIAVRPACLRSRARPRGSGSNLWSWHPSEIVVTQLAFPIPAVGNQRAIFSCRPVQAGKLRALNLRMSTEPVVTDKDRCTLNG